MPRLAGAVCALAASAMMSIPALAQQAPWPTRPITLVVPFAAGGGADIIARSFADQIGAALGQSMIVENRGGAGGNIAAAFVAKASPDGYTILFGSTGSAALNLLTYKNLTYDPRKDFTPVVLIGKSPVIIVARPNATVGGLKDLLADAKANPGKYTAGFAGQGTLPHMTGILIGQNAGADIKHVQYRGGGAIINDLLGGHIDVGIDSMAPYIPQVQDGKLQGLAVTSPERIKQLPDVPTVSEAALPGFEASLWYCLLAPPGLPASVTERLNAVTNEFLRSAKSREILESIGVTPAGGTPDELRAFVLREIEKWGPVVQAAKIEF